MKKIIALRNSGKTGKTSTLIELGNLLLSENTIEVLYPDSIYKNGKLRQNWDFTLIVKLSNKTIGIKSQGDPNCELKKKVQKIIDKYNVDYLFCATRTRGETVGDVYKVAKSNNYEIIWTSTYHSDSSNGIDLLNQLKAKHLLDLLKELIGQ